MAGRRAGHRPVPRARNQSKDCVKDPRALQEQGPRGLYDRSTVPHSNPNKTPPEVEGGRRVTSKPSDVGAEEAIEEAIGVACRERPELKVPTAETINNILTVTTSSDTFSGVASTTAFAELRCTRLTDPRVPAVGRF
jgi:hypothetical protein